MSEEKIIKWIEVGYSIFAKEGLTGLKIEVISRQIKKSKSSFYHYFADMEIYLDSLLEYHTQQAKLIAEKIKMECSNTEDILKLMIKHKEDIFFHKQLRVNRANVLFKNCFEKAYSNISIAFLGYWTKEVDLSNNKQISKELLDLIEENFYLSITEINFTYNWLLDYMTNIKELVTNLKNYKK